MKKVTAKVKTVFSKLTQNIKQSPFFYILLISVFVMAPLITTHGYFYGHDTAFHSQSIVDMEQTDFFEMFNVHIMQDMNHGVGYGSGIFYPQLSHQVATIILRLIKPFNGGVYSAMKATQFIGIFLSGVAMYCLMRRVTRNKTASLLSALCYMTFPYHVGDILIRDAFSESYFFIFMPLVFLGLHQLLSKQYQTFLIWFCIGYIGLINSHLALTLYFTLFLGIISLFFIKSLLNFQTIKYLAIAVGIVGIIVSPFIVGVAQNMLSGEPYVFSTKGMMLNSPSVVNGSRLNGADYLIPEIKIGDAESYKNIPSWLNIFAAILAFLAVINYKKIANRGNKFLLKGAIVLVLLCLFFSTELMHWSIVPQLFRNIQFPWRFNTILAFAISILAGFSLIYYKVNKEFTLAMLFILSCLSSATSVQKIQTYGQSFGVSDYSYNDYYPAALYGMNDDEVKSRAENGAILLAGNADITNYQKPNRNSTSFSVENLYSDSATIEIPRLYYVGYAITGATPSGDIHQLDYKISPNGFISIDITEAYRDISIVYTNTTLYNFARYASAAGLIGGCAYIIYYGISLRKHCTKKNYRV